MSNSESENIQLMGAALIVLSLALLYCWYQSNSECNNNKQYFSVPQAGYQRGLEGFKQNKQHKGGNPLHDMTTGRIIQPFTTNEYKSKANFTSMRRAVDGSITPNSLAVSSPMSMSMPMHMPMSATISPFVSSAPTMSSAGAESINSVNLVAPVVAASSEGANMLARKTSALKKNLSSGYSPFDDSTVSRNLNVVDVQNTHLNDMVNGMTNRQSSTLDCPLSTTAMVMSMSEFTPQYSDHKEYYQLTM